jgi:PAS domain S-box-containing protein
LSDPCHHCELKKELDHFVEQSCSFANGAHPQEHPEQCYICQKFNASEERFKRLAEASFESIMIVKDGHVIDVNQNLLDLHGYTLEELKTINVMALISPEYHDVIKEKMASDYQDPYEVVGLRKDGSTFPLEIKAKSAIINNQKVWIATGRDLTEKKTHRKKLAALQKRFKQLAEAAIEGILIHNLDHEILDFNQQLLDMYGYTAEEFEKVTLMEMVAPKSRDSVAEKIAAGYFKIYQTNGIKKDGTVFPVLVNCKEAVQDNKPVRIDSLYDLTEQEALKQQLAESETKYRELYRNARACLFRTGVRDGKLLDCSRATARLFGYKNEDEFKDAFSVKDTYANPQDRDVLIETLKKNKRVHGYEVELKHKDGSLFWVAISAEIFPEKDCMEGALQDISLSKLLTTAENEILGHLMEGLSNKEIAFKTGRSVRTVEDHRSRIMQKLGVDNIVLLTQKTLKFPKFHLHS